MNCLNPTQIHKVSNSLFKKICISAILLFAIQISSAQELERYYVKSDISLRSDNTTQARNASQTITETISQVNAEWLRLFFEDVNLGESSSITITSVLDGHSQTLTAESIENWQNSSAYFNGDELIVTLNIAANETSVGFKIKELGVGKPAIVTESQCGPADNRVASNDAAIGRIVPIGCTGWIVRNGKLVTAGHCVRDNSVIEFNVPSSNPNRSIVHPGPEDQYPIGNFITNYTGSPADDWAVFTAENNSQTGLSPIQAQGKSFNVSQSNPGTTIRITGYGVDDGSANQTQQTHTGPLASITTTFVRYTTDTEGGNSGSPIIDEATGNAVGVHAYGGCVTRGYNYGERATISDFWDAIELDGNQGPTGPIVQMVKRNASGFALDGNNGGDDGQNVYLWSSDPSNVNQQWIEVDQGGGYYSYVKNGTDYALDGGNGGEDSQNLYLWSYDEANFNQHWRKISAGGSYYRLEKRNASGFSIDGDNGGDFRQNVYLWSSGANNQNQHWQFVTVGTATIASGAETAGNEYVIDGLDISISPNPVVDNFSIKVGENIANSTATILSITGMKKAEIALQQGDNVINPGALGLSPGMHLIQVSGDNGTSTHKILIK